MSNFYNDYMSDYFYYDIHKYNLQDSDIQDLKQEIFLVTIELTYNKGYKRATNKKAYRRTVYINAIKKIVKEITEIKECDMGIFKDCKGLSELHERLGKYNEDKEHASFWVLEVFKELTDLEKLIISYKHIARYSNEEIIEIFSFYKHKLTEESIWQICNRVKKKLLQKYPHFKGKEENILDKYSNIVSR